MISPDPRATQREPSAGLLLIVGSLAMLLVMAFHPTAHDLAEQSGGFAREAHVNAVVHGLALAIMPAMFLGLLGLSRRLGHPDLSIAALVTFGFGIAAVTISAVASGFIAPAAMARALGAEGESRELYRALTWYSGAINQGFTKVYVAAAAVAILLWSAAMLRTGRLSRAAGVFGVLVGAGLLLVLLSGHLRLDVHGFGAVVLAQSAWLVWVGILLCRRV